MECKKCGAILLKVRVVDGERETYWCDSCEDFKDEWGYTLDEAE